MLEAITAVWAYLPGLALLLVASGFFSGSEAAFFSLGIRQRRELAVSASRRNNAIHTVANRLIEKPERLLMGILFWNLGINVAYFSIVSRLSLALDATSSMPAVITVASLVAIVVFGEFLPKSFAVQYPLVFIRLVAIPLAVAIRVLDAFIPTIRFINETSRRLIWPGLKAEPYLELADLDRAVELSTDDSELFEKERVILQNMIRLSEIRVEEWMRPRTQYRSFTPPLNIDQLGGRKTPSGYMLITDPEKEELVAAVDLETLLPDQCENLDRQQKRLLVVPWCTTIADALQRMRQRDVKVAVVVNEFGESVGVLTWDEIFEAILHQGESPSVRELSKAEVRSEDPDVWVATGMTKLRRLERVMNRRLDFSRSLTVAGVVQEQLHRLPELGDVCDVQDLRFEVIESGQRGEIRVRITALPQEPQ